jgi:hypothetical protein
VVLAWTAAARFLLLVAALVGWARDARRHLDYTSGAVSRPVYDELVALHASTKLALDTAEEELWITRAGLRHGTKHATETMKLAADLLNEGVPFDAELLLGGRP